MVNETIPSLRPRVEGEVTSAAKKFGFWMYYRLSDGWISPAPAHPLEVAKRLERKQIALKAYGQFLYDRRSTDANGQRWDARAEPWRMIFQRGGEQEFPVDQVIAFKWHLRSPYQEVSFPQLEGIYWEVYECPDCEKAVFTSLEEGYAPHDMIDHLRLGHGWSRAEVAEYAREVGISFKRERRTHTPAALEIEQSKDLPGPERDPKFKCDVCGWSPLMENKRKKMALQGHKRMKHKVAPTGGAQKE